MGSPLEVRCGRNNIARVTFLAHGSQEMEICLCCGDDFSTAEKKKRRRRTSKQNGEKLLETLMKLLLEQQNSLDLSKLNEGYLCRSCGTLLEKFNRLHQQLSVKIVAVLPHIPLVPPAKHQNDLSECSSDHINVPRCVEATTASTTESPPVVVSIIL